MILIMVAYCLLKVKNNPATTLGCNINYMCLFLSLFLYLFIHLIIVVWLVVVVVVVVAAAVEVLYENCTHNT